MNLSQVFALPLEQQRLPLVIDSGCCFDSRHASKIHFLRLPGKPRRVLLHKKNLRNGLGKTSSVGVRGYEVIASFIGGQELDFF